MNRSRMDLAKELTEIKTTDISSRVRCCVCVCVCVCVCHCAALILVFLKFDQARYNLEKENLEKHNRWLTEELSQRTQELFDFRSRRYSDELSDRLTLSERGDLFFSS